MAVVCAAKANSASRGGVMRRLLERSYCCHLVVLYLLLMLLMILAPFSGYAGGATLFKVLGGTHITAMQKQVVMGVLCKLRLHQVW